MSNLSTPANVDSPDKITPDKVQEARIALLEHYTSQMQAYINRGLTFFSAILTLAAFYFQFEQSLAPWARFVVTVGVGFLLGCIVFSIARFAFYGQVVHAASKGPLKIVGGAETLMGQLDDSITNWATNELDRQAAGSFRWELWRPFFKLGASQTKSLAVCAAIWTAWVVVFADGGLANFLALPLSHGGFMDMSSFLPVFLGVLVGFAGDRVWSYVQNYLGRRDLLRGVKVELEQAKILALALKGNLLPTDNWKSAIYSGRAMLLKQNVRSRVGEMYFAIDNHNYEAKIVRQLGEEARGTLATTGGQGVVFNQAKMQLWTVRSEELQKSETSLAKSIGELLKESYWPSEASE